MESVEVRTVQEPCDLLCLFLSVSKRPLNLLQVLAKDALWNALLSHFKDQGCLVEGSLTNLRQSALQLPHPKKVCCPFILCRNPHLCKFLSGLTMPFQGYSPTVGDYPPPPRDIHTHTLL